MLDKIQSLEKVGLFAGLKTDKEALAYLAQMMVQKTLPVHHELIKEGDLGDEFYVLLRGQVSIYKNTPEGDRYKVVILKSDIAPSFAEAGLIQSEPRSATVVCDVESDFLVLNQKDFAKFCAQKPNWAVPILQKLSLNLMGNLRKTSNDLMLLHRALMNEIRS